MQLHTFIVDSAQEAVDRIRAELGPAAVVVSVRELPANGLSRLWKTEQVEVIAGISETPEPQAEAVDPLKQLRDEIRDLRAQVTSGAPGRATPPHPPSGSLLNTCDGPSLAAAPGGWRLSRLLVQTGLLPIYAEQVEQEVLAVSGDPLPGNIARELELARNFLKARWLGRPLATGRTHLFIGPAGSGKSTVLAKWMAQSVLLENQAAAVYQADTHIANASPLPALYSEILGTRFERGLPHEWDASEISFIDLPGFNPADAKGQAALRHVLASAPGCQVHLVLNAAYETTTLMEQARAWSAFGAASLILTHLDEESRWGKAWNLVLGTNYRVSHFSSGQNIPGDFILATPERLFERQFGPK